MRIQEIMSKNVETIAYDDSAEAAWARMRQRRFHHFVVLRGREVVGVVSDRDLGGNQGQSVRRGLIVADLMTTHPVTAGPQTTVREAANLLRGRSIGCLPVMDGEKLLGIVTVSDLLELIGRGQERPLARASEHFTMKGRGPTRKPVSFRK